MMCGSMGYAEDFWTAALGSIPNDGLICLSRGGCTWHTASITDSYVSYDVIEADSHRVGLATLAMT
jgi:hypothetical protein